MAAIDTNVLDTIYSSFRCLLIFACVLCPLGTPAKAACTDPDGAGGDIIFNADHEVMQYCNDTQWIGFPKTDQTPDPFVFNPLTGQSTAALVTSNTVTLSGFEGSLAVTISGAGSPQFRINGGAWTTTGTVADGDTLQLRLTTGGVGSESIASATVGMAAAVNWSVTTSGTDTTPNSFSFNDVTGAPTSTLTTPSPATLTISGINSSTPVSVSGQGSPQIRIASGSWATSGTITNGQTLAVRLTSSASNSTAHTATIDVGGVTDSWSVTTMTPSDPGFFVLTSVAWNGNLGGLSGADAKCLSDLQANDWLGKSSATLNSSTVKAFLCNSTTCNNTKPNTTYAFARSGSATAGGATFTTNGSGQGPGNTTSWSGATYFNFSTGMIWTNRYNVSSSLWTTTPSSFCVSMAQHCSNWTSASSSNSGCNAPLNTTGSGRWDYDDDDCNTTSRLVCIVDAP